MKTAKDLKIPYAWADRYPVFLEKFFYLPGYYEKHAEWERVPWSDGRLFGDELPVAIEYCSGNGQWIGEKAKQNPGCNWVAVEKCFERARKIWLKLHRESISNLFVVCGEALAFTRYYVPLESVSAVYVNFPDPWPKRRHAHHRLVRAEFAQELAWIATPDGTAVFATDDPVYARQMFEEVSKVPAWQPLLPSPHYSSDWADCGSSFFADLWKQKGRSLYQFPFRKITR